MKEERKQERERTQTREGAAWDAYISSFSFGDLEGRGEGRTILLILILVDLGGVDGVEEEEEEASASTGMIPIGGSLHWPLQTLWCLQVPEDHA